MNNHHTVRQQIICLLLFFLFACEFGSQKTIDAQTQAYLAQFSHIKTWLQVDHTYPKGNVSADLKKIVIHFSQPMVTLPELQKPTDPDFIKIHPKLPGEFQWLNTQTLVYHLREPPPLEKSFEVKIQAGPQSLLGYALLKPISFAFFINSDSQKFFEKKEEPKSVIVEPQRSETQEIFSPEIFIHFINGVLTLNQNLDSTKLSDKKISQLESSLQPKNPILINLFLPQSLRLGDGFFAEAAITNNSDRAQRASLTWQAEDFKVTQADKEINLEKHQTLHVMAKLGAKGGHFSFQNQEKKSRIQLTADINPGLFSETAEITVRFPKADRETFLGLAEQKTQISFSQESDALNSFGGLRIFLGGAPYSVVKKMLQNLYHRSQTSESPLLKLTLFSLFPQDVTLYRLDPQTFEQREVFLKEGLKNLEMTSLSTNELLDLMEIDKNFSTQLGLVLKERGQDSLKRSVVDLKLREFIPLVRYLKHFPQGYENEFDLLKKTWPELDFFKQSLLVSLFFERDPYDPLVLNWLETSPENFKLLFLPDFKPNADEYFCLVQAWIFLIEIEARSPLIEPVLSHLLQWQGKLASAENTIELDFLRGFKIYLDQFGNHSRSTQAKIILNGKEILNSQLTFDDEIFLPASLLPKKVDIEVIREEGAFLFYHVEYVVMKTDPKIQKERGLSVVKTFLDRSGQVVSPDFLQAGQIYEVRLQCFLSQKMSDLVMEDSLPAGTSYVSLEVPHSTLKTNQIRDRLLRAQFNPIPMGLFEFSYFVVAQYRGEFEVPETRLFSESSSQFFATSPQQKVHIY